MLKQPQRIPENGVFGIPRPKSKAAKKGLAECEATRLIVIFHAKAFRFTKPQLPQHIPN